MAVKIITIDWCDEEYEIPKSCKKVLNVWTGKYNSKWEVDGNTLRIHLTTMAYKGTPAKGTPNKIRIRYLEDDNR